MDFFYLERGTKLIAKYVIKQKHKEILSNVERFS